MDGSRDPASECRRGGLRWRREVGRSGGRGGVPKENLEWIVVTTVEEGNVGE